jgi:NADPH:quinone reductase-like Zn-dependent oxidoreductase
MPVLRLGSPAALETLWVDRKAVGGRVPPGSVRVRIHANSLNFHDYAVAAGMMPAAAGRILLSDGAGIVEEVGADVVGVAAGDAVVSCFFPDWQDGPARPEKCAAIPGDSTDGYASTQVIRPAVWFTPVPRGYTHAEASTLPTAALTAWCALTSGPPVKAGDTVLVLGTGGVSIFALQLAKAMGATVVVTSSSDGKLDRARALGADHCINYSRYPDWSAEVVAVTNGRGVDHVIEIGGPATLAQSIMTCRMGGHIALIGVLGGFSGEVPTGQIIGRQQILRGIGVGSREDQLALIKAIEATDIKPVIDRSFPPEELSAAFQHQIAGRHFGKICMEL